MQSQLILIDIQSSASNVLCYGFDLPDGDKLLALWADGIAVDDDSGVSSTVTFNGDTYQKVIAIDILNSLQQELTTSVENGKLIIQDFLVKDYPIILRFIQ